MEIIYKSKCKIIKFHSLAIFLITIIHSFFITEIFIYKCSQTIFSLVTPSSDTTWKTIKGYYIYV